MTILLSALVGVALTFVVGVLLWTLFVRFTDARGRR